MHRWITVGRHRLSAVLHDRGMERVVVMAHGFTGHKAETGWLFTQAARELAGEGFSALRFDFAGSGDSEGAFREMTPRTEMADLNGVLDWVLKAGAERVGVLGLSMGGGVSICTVAQREDVSALATWSSVPDFRMWGLCSLPAVAWERALAGESFQHGQFTLGAAFFTDMLEMDIPSCYAAIKAPKLMVEGNNDAAGFQAGNLLNHLAAREPKKRVIIPGADHTFSHPDHRRRAIAETVEFFADVM